jgi:hypothetical protein
MDTSKETFKAFQQDDVLSTADVASSVVIKPEEEYAYGFIIEVLTSGLYPDVFHVILGHFLTQKGARQWS